MKYAVVFERTPNNYCAYVPDLPGCVATGRTREEVERRIRGAIRLPPRGPEREGEPVPAPSSWTAFVEASV